MNQKFDLNGMLVPFMGKRPVIFKLEDKYVLPIFTCREKYEKATNWCNFNNAKEQIIVKPDDFLNAVNEYKKQFPLDVIVDPYVTEEGNVRFQKLILE